MFSRFRPRAKNGEERRLDITRQIEDKRRWRLICFEIIYVLRTVEIIFVVLFKLF